MEHSFRYQFFEWIQRLGDLILLNLCFVLCCLPLITVGAAKTALYTVCFRFDTAREGGAVRTFFKSFVAGLRQGIPLWLLEAAACLAAAWLALVFYASPGLTHYACIPALALLALILVVGGYVYPLSALFENRLGVTLKNAFILSMGYLPRSILVAALNAAPWGLFLLAPELFLRAGFVWLFLYYSIAAYLSTLLLRKVFAPFLPDDALPE